MESDRFTFCNINWFLGFYTNGDGEDCKGYISLYLFMDSEVSKNINLTIEFSIKIVNHKDPTQTVKKGKISL